MQFGLRSLGPIIRVHIYSNNVGGNVQVNMNMQQPGMNDRFLNTYFGGDTPLFKQE